MKWIVFFVLFLIVGCASEEQPQQDLTSGLQVFEIKPDKWTGVAKQNVEQLLKVYDLRPFLFTKKVHVTSERIVSHSHPVLTINTRYARQPNKILAVLLHEQLHWWGVSKRKELEAAINELRIIYPDVPIENQQTSKHNSYVHLVICYIEFRALELYLGKNKAAQLLEEFIKKEKQYPWVYTQVLKKNFAIKQIVEKNGLLPPPLT